MEFHPTGDLVSCPGGAGRRQGSHWPFPGLICFGSSKVPERLYVVSPTRMGIIGLGYSPRPVVRECEVPQSDSFDVVLDQLREGDERAAVEVFQRYAGRLVRLARSRLDPRLLQKMDPEDVMQSVFQSFFARQQQGAFDLGGWDGLWALLVRITIRKCGRRAAAFHTVGRDVRREMNVATAEDSAPSWPTPSPEPTPEEVAMLTETLERLMRGLNEQQRRIVMLRLQGHTVPEIGGQVACTERTVHRVLAHVRTALQREEDGPDP